MPYGSRAIRGKPRTANDACETAASRKRAGLVRGAVAVLCAGALAACNAAPETIQPLDVDDAAATLVQMTFQAATREAGSRPPTLTPAPTPTFIPPRLYIKTEVKCRSGIGPNFRVLVVLLAGSMVDMLGKYTAQGAWLVQVPGSTASCWVLALDSSPSGSFELLPEVTPQPGIGVPPSAPVNLSWPFYCSYVDGILYEINTSLSWTNTASDANGFRVYRQEALVADVPANVTTYADRGRVELGTDLTYSVEAYNDAGVSPRLVHTIASVCK